MSHDPRDIHPYVSGLHRPTVTDEADRDRFVRRALTARLLDEQAVAEFSHLPLAVLAAVLLWTSLPHTALLVWIAALIVLSLARWTIRRRVARSSPTARIPVALRVAIVAVAVAWGSGFVAVAPRVPLVEVALLLLIICGLTAGATSTLLADSPTYLAYTGAMLGFSAIGAATLLAHRQFVVALALIVLYGVVMAALHSRLRRVLLRSLITEYELEQSRYAADRERAFLDQLITSAPSAIAVLDSRYLVQRTNPAFESMFGYSSVEASGRHLDDLIVPVEDIGTARSVQREVQLGKTVQIELQRRRKDGALIHVRIAAAHLAQTDGTLVIYDDVSEHARAEQALRESEARLFQTLASLPVGIMVINVEGLVVMANDAATQLMGQIQPGAPITDLVKANNAVVAGTDQPYPSDRIPILRAISGEKAAVDDIEIRRPDRTIYVEVVASPIHDRNGNVMFGVAAFTNITERRRVAETLRAARVAAEEATAAKSAFLANMSHEIRTPLNGILGMAELLLDGNLPAEDRRSAELIVSSGELLLHVINDILDFSKIEAGQLDIESTDVDLAAIVESTARLLMPIAAAAAIEIVTEISADVPPRLRGDPTRIRQVLTNLLGNAVKFTKQGEIVVTLEQVAEQDGIARVRFSVRDTGLGIPPDKLDAIFDAFKQADATTTRRYGGTGLGLSISRRLVELMGGQLGVESTVGIGSTFHFELALHVVEAAHTVESPSGTLLGVRVLVTDDNATNRRVIRGMLQGAGCEVSEASNGTEALDAARAAKAAAAPFGLIITDLIMPGLDGFDLIRAVRADPAIAATPSVMVTSVARRGDAQLCRDLGIAACLLKPASRLELLAALRGAVGVEDRAAASQAVPVPNMHIRTAQRSLNVLLAEDNLVNQEVAAAVLRRRGHTVVVVGNGRAAVAAASTGQFDVVLMDLQMPEMDGVESTQEIRRQFGAGRPRIVAVTANALAGERERCLVAGMDGYIAKPFKSVDLIAATEGQSSTPAGGLPVSPSSPSSSPVDLDALKLDLELGGVGEIFEAVVEAFVGESPARIEALRTTVASGDARSIERAAHAFKSAAATIRAQSLAASLELLEHEAHDGRLDDAVARLNDITAAHDAVQTQLANRNRSEAGH